MSSTASLRSVARQDGSRPITGTPDSTYGASVATVRAMIRCAWTSWPVVIQVSPQQASSGITRAVSPADSRYRIAAWPLAGKKWSLKESAQIQTSGVCSVALGDGLPQRLPRERRDRPALVDAGGPLGQPRHQAEPHHPVGERRDRSGPIRPLREPAEEAVAARTAYALDVVLLVQCLGLVRRHVHAGRAVRRAALAGEAEVERLGDRRVGEPLHQRPVDRLLEHPGSAAGGVLLVAGGEVGRAHHARGRRRDALADAGAAVHRVAQLATVVRELEQRQHRLPGPDRAQVGVQGRRIDHVAGVEQVARVADRLDRGEEPDRRGVVHQRAAARSGPGRRRARRTASRRGRAA